LTFRSFSARFSPQTRTTFYEISVTDALAGELRHFWRLRFGAGVCGDLVRDDFAPFIPPTSREPLPAQVPRFTPENGYFHDGCDVDIVERGAKVEVQVVRQSDLTPSGGLERLRRFCEDYPVEAALSGDLLVLRSLPGSASALAAACDAARFDEAVGTIAGDDTVFVAVRDRRGGRALLSRLRTYGVRGS
jgi:hypothetical protein